MDAPKSKFSLEHFLVQESVITRKPLKKAGDFKIKITPSGKIFKSRKHFQLELDITVWEQNRRFKARVLGLGVFSFAEITDKETVSEYFYTNAPAIIFPYIRAYISSLTALSGMEAINLPPLMLGGLRDELKKNTMEVD